MKRVDKKGAAGLIIGIIVALIVVGGVIFFIVSKGGEVNVIPGNESGGNRGSGSGDGGISSWCNDNWAVAKASSLDTEVSIVNYEGKTRCLLEQFVPGGAASSRIYCIDKNCNPSSTIFCLQKNLEGEFVCAEGRFPTFEEISE
jgi:hypothetical protein